MAIKRLHYFDQQFLVDSDFGARAGLPRRDAAADQQGVPLVRHHRRPAGDPQRQRQVDGQSGRARSIATDARSSSTSIGYIDLSNANQFPGTRPVFVTIAYQGNADRSEHRDGRARQHARHRRRDRRGGDDGAADRRERDSPCAVHARRQRRRPRQSQRRDRRRRPSGGERRSWRPRRSPRRAWPRRSSRKINSRRIATIEGDRQPRREHRSGGHRRDLRHRRRDEQESDHRRESLRAHRQPTHGDRAADSGAADRRRHGDRTIFRSTAIVGASASRRRRGCISVAPSPVFRITDGTQGAGKLLRVGRGRQRGLEATCRRATSSLARSTVRSVTATATRRR